MEEAAASLGAGKVAVFRRIVFPNLLPAILSGVALCVCLGRTMSLAPVVLISWAIARGDEVALSSSPSAS